jgi:DNA-binding SARP family transcriptional activator
MPTLTIQLFHTLNVQDANGRLLELGSPTTQSLFAYLVLHAGQAIDRRRLAFLFWPKGTESAARRNLRQYLHRIRRALEPIDESGEMLQTAGHYVQLLLPDDCFVDVRAFEAALGGRGASLQTAVSLYKGDLLEDIYDDWVQPERERLAQLYRETLVRLIGELEQAGDLQTAVSYAEQFLAAEPLLEHAHVRLMQLYYRLGDRGRVAQQFEALKTVLAEELGVEPMPETAVMVEAMLAGSYRLPAANHPVSPLAVPTALAVSTALAVPTTPPPVVEPSVPKTAEFIGRDKEFAWLDSAWQRACLGQGGVCFVMGEMGVGKTRLVEEWLNRLPDGCHIIYGRAHEFEAMIPYAPLAQGLRAAVQTNAIPWELFQPPPAWLFSLLPLLPDLPVIFPGTSVTAVTPQHHIIESLGNFFAALSRHKPLVIYLDNLHWADSPTWNFLGYLSQRIPKLPILLIGTAREEDMPTERSRMLRKLLRMPTVSQLTLPRLTREETNALVQALMPDVDLDPVFLRRIYEEAEGNPFFVIETVRAVREAGGDWTESVPTDASGNRPFFAIPLQVQAVIESRLDKLTEESRNALGVAAAIGREFSFQLLQEVSQFDTETLLNALDQWLARGLVRETRDGYDFTHEKLSQVAYEQLSRARRQWIHRRIADYLAASHPPATPAQLAHHYYLSTDPGLALPYLAQAGQRALSVRSYQEAREFGLRAIGLLGRTPRLSGNAAAERIDLNLQVAQAYAFTGGLPKALQLLREAERMAEAQGDVGRLARIFRRSAQIFWLQGSPETADTYARRTLRHAEELDDDRLRFAALRMLGRVNIVLSHFDDAIAYLLRYIDLAEAQGGQPDLPAVYGYLGVAYARVGSWQRALDAAQRGFELTQVDVVGAMHLVARMQLAFVYAELREWENALAVAEPIRDQWQEEGMTPYAFMLRTVYGRSWAQLHSDEKGTAEIEAALQWAEETDYRVQVHVVQLYLAQAYAHLNQRERALEIARAATERAQQVGDRWAEAVGLRTQAEVAMRLPKPDWLAVENLLVRGAAVLRQIRARPDLARTYLTLRRLYDRAGQTAWAVDCHFRAISIFEELDMGAELQEAQGQPGGERTGAVVIHGLALQGPNQVLDE